MKENQEPAGSRTIKVIKTIIRILGVVLDLVRLRKRR